MLSGTSSDDNGCTQEKFERLLAWLHPDSNEAAKEYGEIGFRLFKYFERRLAIDGYPCADADILASRTMDRVCPKMPELADNYEGKPIKYFYGVARKVYQEHVDELKKRLLLLHLTPSEGEDNDDDDKELRHKCLDECLKHFSASERDLLLEYFQDDKKAKIDHRKELAEKFEIPLNTLRMRIFRLKEVLAKCIFDCMKRAHA